jgi:hypothetical protein
MYEIDESGDVRVETPAGVAGVFSGNGEWITGELRSADPELCRWIRSGNHPSPRLQSSRRFTALTSKIGADS